jgi:predicted DNA-binding protein with PD1-like motif
MQAINEGTGWVLRLDEGQDLFETLASFVDREHINAAAVLFGIGMFRSATFGFWDGTQYVPHEVPTPHEVVALHGTVARAEGHPSVHLHGAVAGPDHHLVGGHLLRATIGLLLEVVIETFPSHSFGRPLVESRGLRMLDLEPGPNP